MGRKRKSRPHLSAGAQKLVEGSGAMLAEVLNRGGVPAVIIGSRVEHPSGYLGYFIVSPLPQEKILYVLKRVVGLMEGTIPQRFPSEMN